MLYVCVRVRVCACVCVWELPPTAVHVWDSASHPGHIFSIHWQWWRLSVKGGCCEDTTFVVDRLGWRRLWRPQGPGGTPLEALSGATTAYGQSPTPPSFTSHLLPVPVPLVCPWLSLIVATHLAPLRAWSVCPPAASPTPASPRSGAVTAACPCGGTSSEHEQTTRLQSWCCVNGTSNDLL